MTDWELTSEPFDQAHPCLAGHFPANPIIPGTLILDRVIELLHQRDAKLVVKEVVSAKFLRPLLPDQAFSVSYRRNGDEIRFDCTIDGARLTTGRLKVALAGEAS